MINSKIEPDEPFMQSQIAAIERDLDRALPKDYCSFVKKYGGAFVGGVVDGSEDFPILSFFDASEDNGIIAQLKYYPDLKSEQLLPIARCELGNLWVLDLDNAVYYINYYGGTTTASKVADSFGDFLSRIVVEEE